MSKINFFVLVKGFNHDLRLVRGVAMAAIFFSRKSARTKVFSIFPIAELTYC